MDVFNSGKYIEQVLDWSEVWALCIPISVLLFSGRKQPAFIKPVIIYLWVALALNLLADIIANFKTYLPGWAYSNNPLYNIHSIVRFTMFHTFISFGY